VKSRSSNALRPCMNKISYHFTNFNVVVQHAQKA
jgi:hypothetical protein